MKELGLSALCVPGHKGLLGPQGIGALMLDEEFAKRVEPLISGGTGSASDSELLPPYMPDRFESGTLNIPGIFGLNAALGFILDKGVQAFRAHEEKLTKRFTDGLEGLPLRLAGTKEINKRVGVISIDFTGRDNAEVAYELDKRGIMTRCGLHCAPSAHKTLGTFPQGTVRFSIGYANTEGGHRQGALGNKGDNSLIFPKAPYSKILTWQVCLFHSRGSDLKIILRYC